MAWYDRYYIASYYITVHYIIHYITLHYITLHRITSHYITLNYITLHGNILHRLDEGSVFASLKPLGSLTWHDVAWYDMIDITLHRITSPYITLYITLHYIALHCIALHRFALLYIIIYHWPPGRDVWKDWRINNNSFFHHPPTPSRSRGSSVHARAWNWVWALNSPRPNC